VSGKVVVKMQIQKHQTNRLETLHGGTISTLIDLGGSAAQDNLSDCRSLAAASKGLWATGVSTDINITYISSGGKVGDWITMDAECDKLGAPRKSAFLNLGKTLLFSTMTLRNANGEVFARGRHTKFVLLAWKDEKNKVGELTDEPDDSPNGDVE
jgi:acyl-coenzyme A thioesterase PaaI-like protein